jgi:murein DD-endopeptidase MepM/ murein hydrolase activator NlpD
MGRAAKNSCRHWGRRLRLLLLLGLCVSFAFAAAAQERTYVVKAKDTLTSIARQHSVTVAALAQHNGIKTADTIYVGQRLKIPSSTSTRPRPAPPKLAPAVQQSITSAPVKARRWQHIIIHHAAVNEGTLKSLDRYHREDRRMQNGLAYHFLIGNGKGLGDGVIAVGDRWKKQLDGGHLASTAQNRTAIGICLIGNFDQTKPTAKQLQSLEALSRALMKRCQLPASAVKTHQQINVIHTRCPGRLFPTKEFLEKLKQPER